MRPVWNPAGLAWVRHTGVAAQHLSYLKAVHYEFLSVVQPVTERGALGVSAQYLGTGDIPQVDVDGASLGTFSSNYGAYALAYGYRLSDRLAFGVAGKSIHATISQLSANAYAADVGLMLQTSDRVQLAGVITNIGSRLKFIEQGDPLPLALRLGGAYKLPYWTLSAESVLWKAGLWGGRLGLEWKPVDVLAIRAGYRTEATKELSALAGFSTGFGIHLWGQELAYAWIPLGPLGSTHYISVVVRLGKEKAVSVPEKRVQTWPGSGTKTVGVEDTSSDALLASMGDQ